MPSALTKNRKKINAMQSHRHASSTVTCIARITFVFRPQNDTSHTHKCGRRVKTTRKLSSPKKMAKFKSERAKLYLPNKKVNVNEDEIFSVFFFSSLIHFGQRGFRLFAVYTYWRQGFVNGEGRRGDGARWGGDTNNHGRCFSLYWKQFTQSNWVSFSFLFFVILNLSQPGPSQSTPKIFAFLAASVSEGNIILLGHRCPPTQFQFGKNV